MSSTLAPSRVRANVQILAAAMLLGAIATPALAQIQNCAGRDLMAELKASDTALYDAIRKAADETANGRNVLWKIEQPDNPDRAPSYLFATMRLTDDRLQTLSPKVTEAMLSARRIAIEVEDTSPRRANEAMKSMLPKVLVENDHRLDKTLKPNEWRLASASLTRTTLPADVQTRVRPWVVNAIMATTDCERSRISAGKLPMNGEIARRAENRGVGTMGLETTELQFQALADVTDDDQMAVLKARLAMADRINDLTETLTQLYLKRDLAALWPLQVGLAKKAGSDEKAVESYYENAIATRTRRMRDRAHMHLQRGGIFIAIDAQSLPGPAGMVALLQEMGYTVTAVE